MQQHIYTAGIYYIKQRRAFNDLVTWLNANDDNDDIFIEYFLILPPCICLPCD